MQKTNYEKREKKKKLHSVFKKSRKFKFQLHMALEENEPNMPVTKGAKEIKNRKQNKLVKKI